MLLDFDRLGALRWMLVALGAAVALFLLLPIVFIVALSFGDSQWLIFPPPGWTLEWYRQLFTDAGWIDSLLTSAKLAVIVTVLSVFIGFLASLALVRGKFRGRGAVQAFWRILVPLAMPGIASGALMVFVMALGYFVTPALLGGPSYMMLAELIAQLVQELLNWGLAGAAAFVLLAVTLSLYALQLRFTRHARASLGGR